MDDFVEIPMNEWMKREECQRIPFQGVLRELLLKVHVKVNLILEIDDYFKKILWENFKEKVSNVLIFSICLEKNGSNLMQITSPHKPQPKE